MSHEGVKITSLAAGKVRELVLKKQDDALGLRLYITGGGCSGFQYGFKLDHSQPDDFIFSTGLLDDAGASSQVSLLVDSISMQYLEGATVDFVENLQGSFFAVDNPKAKTTCGCGSSFSIEE